VPYLSGTGHLVKIISETGQGAGVMTLTVRREPSLSVVAFRTYRH
jgi:hypothetical protein